MLLDVGNFDLFALRENELVEILLRVLHYLTCLLLRVYMICVIPFRTIITLYTADNMSQQC